MKFKLILSALAILSILLAGYFFSRFLEQKKENKRINNNFSVLAAEQEARDFKQTQLLEMKISEIKKSFPELEEKIKKEFDIKLKNVKVVSNTVTTVNHTFKTTIKDSIRLDSVPVQKIVFKDAWLDFEAEKAGEDFFVNKNIQTVPLIQVIHRDKWRFRNLFQPRPILQDIKSDNPFAEIKYSRVIDIKK